MALFYYLSKMISFPISPNTIYTTLPYYFYLYLLWDVLPALINLK